jgi:hypothetical protein
MSCNAYLNNMKRKLQEKIRNLFLLFLEKLAIILLHDLEVARLSLSKRYLLSTSKDLKIARISILNRFADLTDANPIVQRSDGNLCGHLRFANVILDDIIGSALS